MRGVELPGDAGAAVSKDGLGAVALPLGEGPSPLEVGATLRGPARPCPTRRDLRRGSPARWRGRGAARWSSGSIRRSTPRAPPPWRGTGRSATARRRPARAAAPAPGSRPLGSCQRRSSRLRPTSTHRFASGRPGRSGWDRAPGSRGRGSGGEPAATSRENKARRGVTGNDIPIASRTVRSAASPSSM